MEGTRHEGGGDDVTLIVIEHTVCKCGRIICICTD
jgi:hypothetical protein